MSAPGGAHIRQLDRGGRVADARLVGANLIPQQRRALAEKSPGSVSGAQVVMNIGQPIGGLNGSN
jgi:hypothetical protein